MNAQSGSSSSAGIAQNGILRRLWNAWMYGGSGFGGGGGGGGAAAAAGVGAAAAGSTSVLALGAGAAPPSDGVARPAASRRARDLARRCSGTSVIWRRHETSATRQNQDGDWHRVVRAPRIRRARQRRTPSADWSLLGRM